VTRARLALVIVAVVVGCLLTACAGTSATHPSTSGRSGAAGQAGQTGQAGQARVDVDTLALRLLKRRAGIAPCPVATAPPARDGLPDVVLPCLGGGRDVRLSGLRGPMVVNLFAQWCGPCREELPHYQTLHEKAGHRLRVLGLDYLDTRPAGALALARTAGVTYPLVADPAGGVRTAFRVRGLPGIVLVDAAGRVVDVEYRVIFSYAELRGLVRQRLGVRLPR
jgi:thiol-disulfide isomerase/thioredoxin